MTSREKAQLRHQQGLCCSCSNQALPGKYRCQECSDKDKARYATRYARRKANNVCVSCEGKRLSDSVYCQGCLDKQRARQEGNAERLAQLNSRDRTREIIRRSKAGVCIDCADPAVHDNERCRRCWALWYESQGHTRHEARKLVGLCSNCDQRSENGLARCGPCNAKHRVRRETRQSAGLCPGCGQPHTGDRYHCEVCREVRRQTARDRIASGVCVRCGRTPACTGIKHCQPCREVCLQSCRRKNQRLRAEVLAAYGGKCQCPGCPITQPEFLQIDHVHNDGSIHRRSLTGTKSQGVNIYRWLKKNNFPKDRFQLLCANCNYSKARYGYCPHCPEIQTPVIAGRRQEEPKPTPTPRPRPVRQLP